MSRPAAQQREPRELRLEVRGAAVQLGAAIDEEADHAPLEGHRIRPAQPQGGQPGRRHGSPSAAERLAARLALDEQHGRHTGTGQGDGELLDLSGPRRDDGERRARDDREIARLERLERRHAWLQDPDPADLALRAFGGEVRRAERSSGREERAVEVVEGRHASLKATRWPGRQPRSSRRHEVVEQPPELPFDVDVPVRAPDQAEPGRQARGAPRHAAVAGRT